ncbi:MAG: YcaO-like family protein [Oligoflexia bacterium]|nr:YcaO-like family protein [Oligoflexia bacterium]MBF0365203.1 YcaO-like family protein [Oligoflexia bacterium]
MLRQTRSYKEDTPLNTVHKLRGILHDIGMYVYESEWYNPYNNIYSVRLSTEEKILFGTNGKGTSRQFALASAYAEFMERLQNGLFHNMPACLYNRIKDKCGFNFYPDEVLLDANQIALLPAIVLKDIFNVSDENLVSKITAYFSQLENESCPGKCVGVPYYNIKSGEIIHLPLNQILETTGSNGMCAGNTEYEAVFQGLCEILERYAASEIFYNKLCPPTLPREYWEHCTEECSIIDEIEATGEYKVVVKDFSIGKKLPVLAAILIDKMANTYRIKVGSDTSFKAALGRCLTEMYQGIKCNSEFRKEFFKIPTNELEMFIHDDTKSQKSRSEEFTNFNIDGRGQFPMALFGEDPDYSIDINCFTIGASFRDEVCNIINLIKNLNFDVYIRNVSFLGFPSFHIYVPGMSSLGVKKVFDNNSGDTYTQINFSKIRKILYDFDANATKDLMCLAEELQKVNYKSTMAQILLLDVKKTCEWHHMTVALFLSLLWQHLGNFSKAKHFLEIHVAAKTHDNDYYQVAIAYLQIRQTTADVKHIHNHLTLLGYDNELIIEITRDLSSSEGKFKYIRFPKCPNCEACSLRGECIQEKKIEHIMAMYSKFNKKILPVNFININADYTAI